ncbi:hypothetical protein GHT07_16590 [Caenimonas koreensis DSM 17982]|uniref:Uncharacterized protein n=1 Tax=Caenimonas koreensis DSM 17982 TaxID=1121255 RepID=A0A844BBT7_9BURK|nr:hypothetical protein [Caenimonas koreensis]MRD48907.1 hypothetical protein [Caenimonas koreensis DSM 17982]
MITTHLFRIVRSLVATAFGLAAGVAVASDTSYYYDGAQKVALSQVPSLAADFSRSSSGAQARLASGLTAVAGDSVARIYRLPASSTDAQAAPAAKALSPVFARGATAGGRLMALPGGVLVKFKPDWTREQVDAWVAAHGFTAARPMDFGKNWFRIDTAAGVASLLAANAIFESGDVLAASPNWWMQTSAK